MGLAIKNADKVIICSAVIFIVFMVSGLIGYLQTGIDLFALLLPIGFLILLAGVLYGLAVLSVSKQAQKVEESKNDN